MTRIINTSDIELSGEHCVEICGISFGCNYRMDGCKATYELHNCMFADVSTDRVYSGNITLRFNEDKSCQSALIDADSLTEIVTGQAPHRLEGLNWVGFLQPVVEPVPVH